jgi:hypothetical protein
VSCSNTRQAVLSWSAFVSARFGLNADADADLGGLGVHPYSISALRSIMYATQHDTTQADKRGTTVNTSQCYGRLEAEAAPTL